MKKRKDTLINFFFPKTCINCNKSGEYLCSDCKKTLIPHPEICPYCHKFSANYQTCLECKISPYNYLEWLVIPFSYTEHIKKLISRFKYKHEKELGKFLAERLIIAIQSNQKLAQIITNKNKTIITYVPNHRYRKHFVKWYNQAEILAKRISEYFQIPIIELLKKPESTKSQAKLQRNQRLVNLQWKFIRNQNNTIRWDETILLVDDVTTTNSTLNEAAHSIKEQHPLTKIRWLVLARHN